MKSNRHVLKIGYTEKIEVEKGVFEEKLTTDIVKAQKEQIFQSRKDQAYFEGQPLTARFRIRQNLEGKNLDYVEWKGQKFKVRSATPLEDAHFSIIELGELV